MKKMMLLLLVIQAVAFGQPGVTYAPNAVKVLFQEEFREFLNKESFSISEVNDVLAQYSVTNIQQIFPHAEFDVVNVGGGLGLDRYYYIEFADSTDPAIIADTLRNTRGIATAEPAYYRELLSEDPLYGRQWWLRISHADVERAWEYAQGEGVVVAVIDAGVDFMHEDLRDNIWANPAEDLDGDGLFSFADVDGLDNDNNGYVDDVIGYDFSGNCLSKAPVNFPRQAFPPIVDASVVNHGTIVAGLIAAKKDNRRGIVGVAPKAKIMAIKIFRDPGCSLPTNALAAEQGIMYAINNNARIINCSFSGDAVLALLADSAAKKGIIVVAAMRNVDIEDCEPFACSPSVVGVASIDSLGKKSTFSSYNDSVDIATYGQDLVSTEVGYSQYRIDNVPEGFNTRIRGNSFAAPLVSGALALIWSRNPSWTRQQVLDRLYANVSPFLNLNPIHQGKMGRGILNAYRAVSAP